MDVAITIEDAGFKIYEAADADQAVRLLEEHTVVGDPSQVGPLLDQIDAKIASVTADGPYDGSDV
jgi:hypothetical protein